MVCKVIDMKLKDLLEAFYSGYKSSLNNEYGEVYVNPTKEEIEEVSTEDSAGIEIVNFIFDEKNNKLFVFKWNDFHAKMFMQLGFLKNPTNYQKAKIPYGTFYKLDNKWMIETLRGKNTTDIFRKIERKLGIK
jgi:hypothetical protein